MRNTVAAFSSSASWVDNLAYKAANGDEISLRAIGRLGRNNRTLAREAIDALASIGADIVLPEIQSIAELSDEDEIYAISAYGRIGTAHACMYIGTLARNDLYTDAAIDELEKVGTIMAADELRQIAGHKPDYAKKIIDTLKRFGEDFATVEIAMIGRSNPAVTLYAIDTIGTMDSEIAYIKHREMAIEYNRNIKPLSLGEILAPVVRVLSSNFMSRMFGDDTRPSAASPRTKLPDADTSKPNRRPF